MQRYEFDDRSCGGWGEYCCLGPVEGPEGEYVLADEAESAIAERDAEIERLRAENARMRRHFDELGGELNLLDLLDLYHERLQHERKKGGSDE